jgi:hypothetical protein
MIETIIPPTSINWSKTRLPSAGANYSMDYLLPSGDAHKTSTYDETGPRRSPGLVPANLGWPPWPDSSTLDQILWKEAPQKLNPWERKNRKVIIKIKHLHSQQARRSSSGSSILHVYVWQSTRPHSILVNLPDKQLTQLGEYMATCHFCHYQISSSTHSRDHGTPGRTLWLTT